MIFNDFGERLGLNLIFKHLVYIYLFWLYFHAEACLNLYAAFTVSDVTVGLISLLLSTLDNKNFT